MKYLSLLLFIIISFAPYAEDEENEQKGELGLTQEYDICINGPDVTNAHWAECGQEEIERQNSFMDKELKRALGALKQHDGPGCTACSFDLLKEEQEKWLAWKDVACNYLVTIAFGRQGAVLSHPICKAQIIAHRAADLKGIADEVEERLAY